MRAVAEGRLPARVLPGAADHDRTDVVGRAHDRQHRVGRIHHVVMLDLLAPILRPEARERKARMLEEKLLHLFLRVTVAGDGRGVLGAERQERPSTAQEIVAAPLPHGASHGQEDAEAGRAEVILDVVRPLAAERVHDARVGRQPDLDVQRLPRVLGLVLRDTVGDLGRAALGGSVANAGRPPPTFIRTSRIARPIVTLARKPWPKALYPALSPISRAIGPLTTRSGATGWVVAWMASRLNSGWASASMPARITGRYSGRQPAITALAAMRSTVASPCRGGSTPRTSRGSRSVQRRNSRTAASVGGTIASPSVQTRS